METNLAPFAMVRVKLLRESGEQYDGWRLNVRPPAIGDTGAIVDVLQATGLPDKFVVESVVPDGTTLWLADFFAEEIELVQP